jgi:hypothetical protein
VDAPAFDVFGGYVYMWDTTDSVSFPRGWMASASRYLNDQVAIVGEVAGSYKSVSLLGVNLASGSLYTFTAGPKFSGRAGNVTAFGQVLGGLEVGSASNFLGDSASSTGFALLPGFGVDVPVAGNLGVRIGGEFGFIHDSGVWIKGFRFMTGLVVTGGAR